jgi:hypothetical protein
MRIMCFGKGTGISGGGQGSPIQDLPGLQPCQVETYSGYRVHERPRRFTWQGEWLEVRRVVSRWQEPENLGFIVTANDSRRYFLKYHFHRDAWEVLIWRDSDSRPG